MKIISIDQGHLAKLAQAQMAAQQQQQGNHGVVVKAGATPQPGATTQLAANHISAQVIQQITAAAQAQASQVANNGVSPGVSPVKAAVQVVSPPTQPGKEGSGPQSIQPTS